MCTCLIVSLTVTLVDELQQLVESASNVRSVAVEHGSVSGHDAVGVVEHDHLRLEVSSGHGRIVLDVSCKIRTANSTETQTRLGEIHARHAGTCRPECHAMQGVLVL